MLLHLTIPIYFSKGNQVPPHHSIEPECMAHRMEGLILLFFILTGKGTEGAVVCNNVVSEG